MTYNITRTKAMETVQVKRQEHQTFRDPPQLDERTSINVQEPRGETCADKQQSSEKEVEAFQSTARKGDSAILSCCGTAKANIPAGSAVEPQESGVPEPAPDGGSKAWLCVLGTHLVVMNTWGLINSFGVFQSYYVTALGRLPSEISWIGSLEIFLLFFVGTLSGRLTDAGFLRPVLIAGIVLITIGIFTASVSTQYWQILLAQGVCIGLGNGCLFCPAIALVSTYFQKRRALAIGITACGGTTGGIVFPLLVRNLLPLVGFGWSMRAIGFIQAGSLTIALLLLNPRISARKAGPLVEWKAFEELEYTFYALGSFMCFWGSYIAFFYISAYARDIGMSYTTSLNLVMIMNGIGTIGRLLPCYLADRVGTLTIFIPTALATGVLMFCWIAISSHNGLYAWAAIAGIAVAGIQSLFPSALAALTADPQKQGTRIGMVFTIVSLGVLTGPPIEGALISMLDGRYIGAQSFAGGCLFLGTGFFIAAREVKRRKLGEGFWMKL